MQELMVKAFGLRIAYDIINPEKTNTIFFIHGNSSSSNTWRKQVNSPLLAGYRLVVIDLPSHGKSDEMDADGDYSLPGIAAIMADVISQLQDQQPYIIAAASLGTNIAVESLYFNLTPKGLLLAGPCIVGEGFDLEKLILQDADVSAVFAENVPVEKVKEYASATSSSENEVDKEFFLEDYNAVKGAFRSCLFETINQGNYNDEIVILKNSKLPICIVFGKGEKVVNNIYLNGAPINLWNDIIYLLAGASHLVNIDAPKAFNELLAEFAGAML